LNTAGIIATIIFLIVYIVIASEKIHRTTISLLGASFLLLFIHFTHYGAKEAFAKIDFNTIFLLIGMMVVVGITKETGVFDYLAIKTLKQTKGSPLKLLITYSIMTAVLSAFFDNVTTVLMIAPITLFATEMLKIDPKPFMIAEIFAANIGGTATLIGDPPNIMIGTKVGMTFNDFIRNTAPISIINLFIVIGIIVLFYHKEFSKKYDSRLFENINLKKVEIKDKIFLIKALSVLVMIFTLFILQEKLEIEPSVTALFGASLLILITGKNVEKVFEHVEWSTIFFFIGLFILVGGLEFTGVLETFSEKMIDITSGNFNLTVYLILWVSALSSSFVDNIPYTATMIPIIKHIIPTFKNITPHSLEALWWALSLGACFGGNGTIVGASANVVIQGLAAKEKHKISFMQYFKIGFIVMIITIITSTFYLAIFYLK
jgi:Na+/H+ antiporter NhaD/arsenite permease-like protein